MRQPTGSPFFLYLWRKKSYNRAVPICPRCNATIHTGAEDQCPVCGYSLERANRVFGAEPMIFHRVHDEAGALTHQERQDLLRVLEDMERNIPPIALCIYITAHGQVQEFRSHAHWVLNHARIYHPSFGRREKSRAIEDADLKERQPGEAPHEPQAPPTTLVGMLSNWWQRLRSSVRDALHPYPPPVKQEWMLMLVLDVQLEMACFTWGYMLDPYVNPDSINSCIIGARLHFRERAMAVGLRKVMKAAVNQIASQSHRVNRHMTRVPGPLMLAVSASVGLLLSAPMEAQVVALLPDEDVAEEVEDDTPAVKPTAAPPVAPGAPASYTAAPRWADGDYRHLLSGELSGCYRMLRTDTPPRSSQPEPPPRSATPKQVPENDAKISKHYYRDYTQPDKRGIIDPQRLLSNVEHADVEHTLRTLNAHAPYRMYVAVFKQGQEVPLELAAGALVRSVAQPGEYAALLMYGLGDTPKVELGFHEIRLSDEDRLAWVDRVRQVALRRGGVEGLMAAAKELHTCLAPVAAELPPLTQQTAGHLPLIPIEMRDEDEADEVTFKDEIRMALQDPDLLPGLATTLAIMALGGLAGLCFWLRRRSGHLFKSEPDIRLASPFGAGVSRNVSYLEGKEVQKASRGI